MTNEQKTMQTKDTIKNCPFCGGEAKLTESFGWEVKCHDCGMGTRPIYDARRGETIRRWNLRARR